MVVFLCPIFWPCVGLSLLGNKYHTPPPPKTFLGGLYFTHQDSSKFKLLALQTLQTLSGIYQKYFIQTLLAYSSERNLKSKQTKEAVQQSFLSSQQSFVFLQSIGLEIYISHLPKPIFFFSFFTFCWKLHISCASPFGHIYH